MSKPDYDTTLARMAGNIAGTLLPHCDPSKPQDIARAAVLLARLIVAEIKKQEPF